MLKVGILNRWEDFDPRLQKHRGTASERLPALLDKLQGKDLVLLEL